MSQTKYAKTFSPATMLVLIILVAAPLGIWFLYPRPLNIRIDPVPTPLSRYDDGAGHTPLQAAMLVTNLSNRTVWYLGGSGSPDINYQKLEDGSWSFHSSSISDSAHSSMEWTALKGGESITVSVGAISEEATEMRVGLAFTTEWLFTPTKVHWVHSPNAKLVKRGEDYFWEPVPGASQEVQVLRLPSQGHK